MDGQAREAAAQLLGKMRGARRVAALTGAGISTLSGIRDFRGKNGLGREMDAERVFSLEWFERDPSLFYSLAGPFVYGLGEKEPSIAHVVLAELEARGILKAVVTQNIDMLHQKGGSRRVIEIHGSPAEHCCLLGCPGASASFGEAARIVRAGGIPRCPECGGALKPAVTFFGESLPADALREAVGESRGADLMLVLGTSLTVHPAASMPEHTLRGGGEIVIVNDMPTPLDRHASMRFGGIGPLFEALRECLG